MANTDQVNGVVLLRGVNVTGSRVKGAFIERVFLEAGIGKVSAVLASGNVLVSSWNQRLRTKVEFDLQEALGTPVSTFYRSVEELAVLADFGTALSAISSKIFVMFLTCQSSPVMIGKVKYLLGPEEMIWEVGIDLLWCTNSVERSRMSNASLERITGMPSTLRSITTVRLLITKAQWQRARAREFQNNEA